MTLDTLQGDGLDIDEPDWSLLIPNQGRTKADSNRSCVITRIANGCALLLSYAMPALSHRQTGT